MADNGAERNGVSEAIGLFKFIRELNRTQEAVKNIKAYSWSLWISDIPYDPEHIEVNYYDEEDTENGVLLSVKKPDFTPCPEPDEVFRSWLKEGWNKAGREADVISAMPCDVSDDYNFALFDLPESAELFTDSQEEQLSLWQDDVTKNIEKFEDNEKRVRAFEEWCLKREDWAAEWELNERVQKLFDTLYEKYSDLKRDAEASELVVANGILRSAADQDMEHPILTHRVSLAYDADENEMRVLDTDTATDFYAELFGQTDGDAVHKINELVQESDVHPFERGEEIEKLLTRAVRTLSPKSVFAKDDIPVGWEALGAPYLMRLSPCLIFRVRRSRVVQAVGEIIDDINEKGTVPRPIRDIVVGGKREPVTINTGEQSVEEELAAVGGESADILLSKEANKEQLEIAHAIEHYDAVLVQGPPGTGKTHTIANLLGHFLAQGKSVLVTSYTAKALSVLKSKVAPGLRDLCVEVLGDTNDMEKSVNVITSRMMEPLDAIVREMASLKEARDNTMTQLAEVRRRLFAMRHRECACLVYNGEGITPLEAAKFVQENEARLGFIPGEVKRGAPLPLGREALLELYSLNGKLSREEEVELGRPIPEISELIAPEKFDEALGKINSVKEKLGTIADEKQWQLRYSADLSTLELTGNVCTLHLESIHEETLDSLKEALKEPLPLEDWICSAIADGVRGGAYRERWLRLIEAIEETEKKAEVVTGETFGREIVIKDGLPLKELEKVFKEMRTIFEENGVISRWQRFLHSEYKAALAEVSLDGAEASSAADCDLVLHSLELASLRQKCASYWEALPIHLELSFEALDNLPPEHEAAKYVPFMKKALDFEEKVYKVAGEAMASLGLSLDRLSNLKALDRDDAAARKKLIALREIAEPLCRVLTLKHEADTCRESLSITREALTFSAQGGSALGRALYEAFETCEEERYASAYEMLSMTAAKKSLAKRREELLEKLGIVAPKWAAAVRHRDGVHGVAFIPDGIEDAWKWKQLSLELDELNKEPFEALQRKSRELGRNYREVTVKYAEKSAWYHLSERTQCDLDIGMALKGWKLSMKKIGKGTGKRAPVFRAAAREKMRKCQSAVPCWIMPIGQALESLSPRENKFDIVIIDEASQADLSSLAILYLGEKLIVVGDDEQVSPMAVGTKTDKAMELAAKYIPYIPNADIYAQDTSVYDIVGTTFTPLMLREHFRCVPEIIGFSNELSYHGAIKPLRAASSSHLIPAVVPYRVKGGKRLEGKKVNPDEAKTIVALLKACLEQEEYADKTFGIISLLGNEQVRTIQSELQREISWREIEERRILCGNSAHFQGDERDVIFLSMVDSGKEKGGPLSLLAADSRLDIKKRYNVAASRARDQLWVVYSLDPATDLKAGDLRKRLIDYALNPRAAIDQGQTIAQRSDSPFEEKVAKALFARGYHIAQQWDVGAYRIDIVALYKNKKIAIECDGERFHSSDEAIRNDMERQTILERLGWRFIRIRGSEYFRYPKETIERVVKELGEFGIEPESTEVTVADGGNDTELLSRVKRRAGEILNDEESDKDTILKMKSGSLPEKISEPIKNEDKFIRPKVEIESRGGALFSALVRQIAVSKLKKADRRSAVWEGLQKELDGKVTPDTVLDISEYSLVALGLNDNKIFCLKDLAQSVKNGSVNMEDIAELPENEAVEALLCLSGVGKTVAERAWALYMNTK